MIRHISLAQFLLNKQCEGDDNFDDLVDRGLMTSEEMAVLSQHEGGQYVMVYQWIIAQLCHCDSMNLMKAGELWQMLGEVGRIRGISRRGFAGF